MNRSPIRGCMGDLFYLVPVATYRRLRETKDVGRRPIVLYLSAKSHWGSTGNKQGTWGCNHNLGDFSGRQARVP